MGTIEQSLNNYIWNNINILEVVFSEKIYKILVRFKEKNDKESFSDTLEALVEVDNELLEKIEIIYQNYPEGVKNKVNLHELYFEKALDFYNKEEYDKAIIYSKKTIEINSKYDKVYKLLVKSFYFLKKYEEALEICNKALETNSQNHEIYFMKGILYHDKKDYQKAINYYKKAIDIDSNFPEAYHRLGIIFSENHEENIANNYFNQAILSYEKNIKNNLQNMRFTNLNKLKNYLDKAFFLDKKISNLNIYIDKLKIKDFKQYQNFSIDFSKQINIIIGQNAIGKTTLLQAITLGLLKEDSSDVKQVEYEDYISNGKNESELIIYHNVEEKKIKILKEKREIDKNYFIPFVLAYGSNFFTSKTNEVKEVAQGIVNETVHKGFTSSIFVDYTSGFVNPIRLLEFLDLEKDEKVPKIQKTFIDTINSFLEGFKLIENSKNYYFQKDGADAKLKLEELSEGYRSNVLLITDILIKILGVGYTPKTIEGVILIDEFDKHLHPKWQSKLVNQLTKTFPKIQFIMTTHNPMSILDRNSDEITKLVETKDGIKAIQGRGTKSIDVSIVLLEYFGVESTVSETMQKHISDFNRLKLKKELTTKEQQELKELEQYLGNTIASNLIYNRPYLKFLEFIRDHKEIDFDRYEKMDDDERDKLLEEFGDLFND